MKINYTLFAFALLFLACSSEDTDNTNNTIVGDYFPSNLNDTWTYAVENNSTTNPEYNYSETDIGVINTASNSTFTLQFNGGNNAPIYGTSNSIFSNGTFTKTESTLTFDGDITLLANLGLPSTQSITLDNFLVYDLNAQPEAELAITQNTINEDLELDGLTIPLTIAYQVSNTNKSTLASLTINGTTYNNVIRTNIKVNLSILGTITVLGIPSTQSILDAQDVLVIDHYYAKDIGLIKSTATQGYTLNPAFLTLLQTAGTTVDFPTNVSFNNTQDLTNYSVSN